MMHPVLQKFLDKLIPRSCGYYWLFSDFYTVGLKTSTLTPPLSVESAVIIPATRYATLDEEVSQFLHTKEYVKAFCAIHPKEQIMHRLRIDVKGKRAEPAFLAELAKDRARINFETQRLAIVLSNSGEEYEETLHHSLKDFLFLAAPHAEFDYWQKWVLGKKIYPLSLEIGSLATMGALAQWLSAQKQTAPVLFFEPSLDRTQLAVVSASGIEMTHLSNQGIDSIIPTLVKDLKLKDHHVAKEQLFSGTLPLNGSESASLEKIIKDIKACLGFYEMQHGNPVEKICFSLMPKSMQWARDHICHALELTPYSVDVNKWVSAIGVTIPENLAPTLCNSEIDAFSLFALLHRNPTLQNNLNAGK